MAKKGEAGWSRGLTKDTHPGLKRMSEKLTGRTKETHPGVKSQSEKITGRTKETHDGVRRQSEKITGRTKETHSGLKRVSEKLTGRTKENTESVRRMAEKKRGRTKENDEGTRRGAENRRGRTKENDEGTRRGAENRRGRTKENDESVRIRAEKVSKIFKLKWQTPEFVSKMLKAQHTKPTKPEKVIDDLLKRILPGEYELNVFGKTVLAGKIPDFVNINGKKKAIEFNGCYFHDCPECFGGNGDKVTAERVELFKQHGWSTLVIWEHEMDDMVAVTNKILGFHDLPYITASRQLSLFDCEVKNVI